MATKLPSGNWRVRWNEDDKRFSQSFPNKELAVKFESKLNLDLVKKEILPVEEEAPSFADFCDQWHSDYCQMEKAKSQWVVDESVIRVHLKPALGKFKLTDLKKSHLLSFIRNLRCKKKMGKSGELLSTKSVNNAIVLAKKIMSTAVDWDIISENPFSTVKPIKMTAQRFDFWNPEDRDSFLRGCSEMDSDFCDAVLLACHTGLRLGEIAGLKWGSIDFHRKMITVKESYNYRINEQIPRTKNGGVDDVPMNRLVLEMLKNKKAMATSDRVFELRLLQSACHKLKYRCRALGIKPIRFHDLRHSFASCLAMAGVDLMIIKELMRHRSYQMTLRYAHLHPDHLAGKTEILCSRGHDSGHAAGHAGHENFSVWPRSGHESQNPKVIEFASFRK